MRATRTGIGGIVGQKRSDFSWRFVVDFAGGDLSLLGEKARVQPRIWVSRGRVETWLYQYAPPPLDQRFY